MKTRPRPLSPHLRIYSWLITSTLSILHRLTGVALSAGLLLVVCWLLILAYTPSKYNAFSEFLRSPIGLAMLGGWSLAMYYHLLNGIRHLFWDFGKGFDLKNVTRSGVTVVVGALALTAFTWLHSLGLITASELLNFAGYSIDIVLLYYMLFLLGVALPYLVIFLLKICGLSSEKLCKATKYVNFIVGFLVSVLAVIYILRDIYGQ